MIYKLGASTKSFENPAIQVTLSLYTYDSINLNKNCFFFWTRWSWSLSFLVTDHVLQYFTYDDTTTSVENTTSIPWNQFSSVCFLYKFSKMRMFFCTISNCCVMSTSILDWTVFPRIPPSFCEMVHSLENSLAIFSGVSSNPAWLIVAMRHSNAIESTSNHLEICASFFCKGLVKVRLGKRLLITWTLCLGRKRRTWRAGLVAFAAWAVPYGLQQR